MRDETPKPITPPTYPARPINGGPWEKAKKWPKMGSWFYEPKFNGWRATLHLPTGRLWNRHGEPLSIEHEFQTAIALAKQTYPSAEWLDCEALERRHKIGKGTLIVLDVIVSHLSYEARRRYLENIQHDGTHWRLLDERMEDSRLYLTPRYTEPDGLWETLKKADARLGGGFYEGFVAKRADSYYPIQLRSDEQEFSGWVKHRWHF